ncbi:hypothetical protein [Methylophilus luteus]|uniref:Uncharacterized protein n=1 Tax=Methylophilus luteus TaxID=640108 RepID=A0ABW3F9D9_9PROT
MKKYLLLLMFINFSAFANEAGTQTPPNQATNKNKEFNVKLDDSYEIFTSKTKGGTVYYLHCKNNTLQCGYNWDELCEGGKAVAANPLGAPLPDRGNVPTTTNDPDIGLLRIFMCVDKN